MAIEIKGGWLDGHMIRRARKVVSCNDFRHCQTTIKAGDYYAESECDPYYAGGFGMTKLCMNCAGEEAKASLRAALEIA